MIGIRTGRNGFSLGICKFWFLFATARLLSPLKGSRLFLLTRVLLLGSTLHVHLLQLLQNRLVWSYGCVGLRDLTWQLGLDRSELFRPVSSKDS
jgi:hypothetical protein